MSTRRSPVEDTGSPAVSSGSEDRVNDAVEKSALTLSEAWPVALKGFWAHRLPRTLGSRFRKAARGLEPGSCDWCPRIATNAPPHRLTAGPELETLFATQALSMACQARLQWDLDKDGRAAGCNGYVHSSHSNAPFTRGPRRNMIP